MKDYQKNKKQHRCLVATSPHSASQNAPYAQSSLSLDCGDKTWYPWVDRGSQLWLLGWPAYFCRAFWCPLFLFPHPFCLPIPQVESQVCVWQGRQGQERPHAVLSCVCLYTHKNHSTEKDFSGGLKRLQNLQDSCPSRYWFSARKMKKYRDDR